MAKQPLGPRKRRTREHVIADQSRNYVERFIIDEGHTAERPGSDYGYDLYLVTYDGEGYVEPGLVYIQLKAAEALDRSGEDFVFDLDIKDYNLWMMETMPVILVLFDASNRRACWLHVQRHFEGAGVSRPAQGAKTVRLRVPARQAINRRAIATLRGRKQEVLDRLKGEG